MMGISRRGLSTLAVAAMLAACAPAGPPTPPRIVTAADLAAALEDAEAGTLDLGLEAEGRFGVPLHRFRIRDAEIEVHEFSSAAARAAISGALSPDGASLGGRPLTWTGPPHLWATGRLIVAYAGTDGGTILLLNALLGDPLTSAPSQVDEPYPPAVTAAIGALAVQAGVDPGVVTVVVFESVDWPDACLGLPAGGEACAEVITPGWRVVLRIGDEEYVLRTDELGAQVRGPVEGSP